MPLLNFKKQFVEPIRSGTKKHTIRAVRAVPVKAGDKLYLYCGARTKNCFKVLPEPVICTKVQKIAIDHTVAGPFGLAKVTIDGECLEADERQQLAQADGFHTWTDMLNFWIKEHGDQKREVHFNGHIIHWTAPKQDDGDEQPDPTEVDGVDYLNNWG